MKNNRIITITGPSMSGKSTAMQMMLEHSYMGCEVVPKFKTRPRRPDDDEEVISVQKIPDECDLVYEQAGTRYGLSSNKIYDALKRGRSPVVILNDIRAIEDVRSILGPIVLSFFIFREEPNLQSMLKIAEKREVSEINDTLLRLNKARAIYRIYIENIQLFDYVLINSGDREILGAQVSTILDSISEKCVVNPFLPSGAIS